MYMYMDKLNFLFNEFVYWFIFYCNRKVKFGFNLDVSSFVDN